MNTVSVQRILLIVAIFPFVIFCFGCGFDISNDYIFDSDVLEQIVLDIVGQDTNDVDALFDQVLEALRAQYPDHIASELTWSVNDYEGVPGQIAVLYNSVTEYLIFAGSPTSIEWLLGPYDSIEIRDFILDGQLCRFGEEQFQTECYDPGERVELGILTLMHYYIPEGETVWMLEYGRGILPSTLYSEAFAADPLSSWLSSALADLTSLIVGDFVGSKINEWLGVSNLPSF